MKRSLLLSVWLGLFFTFAAQAQRMVSGKVTSGEDGSALPGVSVVVKGTTNGTTTDVEGNYKITVPDNATLLFSYVGFIKQEQAVGPRSVVDVALVPDTKVLTEVVVTGYGVQAKRELTGSIARIGGEQITSLPVQSFEQALQGRAAGVNITTPNGVLGNAPVIRIRGTNSITSGADPLIVIDGLPITSGNATGTGNAANNALAAINNADIESFEVLKDAAATAIYGSRAANGVILITTKSGRKGKAQVTYDAWVGATEAFRRFDLLNAAQYVEIKNEGYRNNPIHAGVTEVARPFNDANGNPVDTDWYDVVLRTGFQHNHSVGISGAGDKTSYFFSVGYSDQEGMLRANDFQRTTARMNINHQATNWLTLGGNVQYTHTLTSSPSTGVFGAFGLNGLGRLPLTLAPNIPVRNPDGTPAIDAVNNRASVGNNFPNAVGLNWPNPLYDLEQNTSTSTTDRMLGNVFIEVRPIKGLALRTTYGLDRLNTEDNLFQVRAHGVGFVPQGLAINSYQRNLLWNWQNTATYTRTFGTKHSLNLLAATEVQQNRLDGWSGSRQGVADDFFTSYQGNFTTTNPPPFNLETENGLISYFGRVNYAFADKYLFSATVRRDGFSALSANNKFGIFGAVSAGWRLSEEDFFKKLKWDFLSEFKLRGSFGTTGNTNLPNNFGSLNFFGSGLYGDTPMLVYGQAGNPNLKWEQSRKLDLGFDAALLANRITLEFAYYLNNISDLIIGNPQPPSKGIPGNSIQTNIGSMRNSGIELTINTVNIDKGGFKWTTSWNLTTNENKITALNQNNDDIPFATGNLELTSIARVGHAVGSLFAVPWAGVNPENGQAMFVNAAGRLIQYNHASPATARWTFVDNGQATVAPTGADRVIAGNTNPRFFGGFDNTFRYKGFDLGIFLQYAFGFYLYNGTRAGLLDQRMWNNSTEILSRWRQPGNQTTVPRLVYTDNTSNGSAFAMTRNVERGDFVRVRNLNLGYTLPASVLKKLSLTNARVYAQVQNAFVFTNYTGSDPEVSANGNGGLGASATNIGAGVDRNSLPQARTYAFGLNITF
ncbi:MAG: TonB-dependent receptor [Bernardetiaceae bacterium]|nr:TonB-dependent receptor [Bernardetiaceae bacterium]